MHIQDREQHDLKMSLNAESDLASGSGCLQPTAANFIFQRFITWPELSRFSQMGPC